MSIGVWTWLRPRTAGRFGLSALLAALFIALVASSANGAPFTFSLTGSLGKARHAHTTTLLSDGKVLIAGGVSFANNTSTTEASAELYDPATGAWKATGTMATPRLFATATLLQDGRVLVAGGGTATAEVYDPVKGTWTPTGSMSTARREHTATLLADGKVLVSAGGNKLASAELYDPTTGVWSNTGNLSSGRTGHMAVLLPNGRVLVAGGISPASTILGSAEIYDPASGSWSTTASLITARYNATATLLASGKVLVAGGGGNSGPLLTSVELYDPQTAGWTATGSLNTARFIHTSNLLPNGKVLVIGGADATGHVLTSAELYNPANGQWTATGSLNEGRSDHTATMLPSGKVLVTSGSSDTSDNIASNELYDPALGIWSSGGSLMASRDSHTLTLLPDGRVLAAGGADQFGAARNLAEIYDSATNTWSLTGNLNAARHSHTATLLANGKVLVAGGVGIGGNPIAIAELFDPATGTWSNTGSLGVARDLHTATLLPNGKIYVAGGESSGGGLLASAELYDPTTGTWSATGNLINPRRSHTATLLTNGKVLIVEGFNTGSFELYDPASGSSTNLFTLGTAIYDHTATLLPDGKVLLAGGQRNSGPQNFSPVYDPVTNTLFAGATMATARHHHTAVLLPNGKVLISGGTGTTGALSSAELYDPHTPIFPGSWNATANLTTEHTSHKATLLLNGKVLLVGGRDANGNSLGTGELYDTGLQFNNTWQPQITTSPGTANRSAKLSLGGVRFKGISEASAGTFQNSSTNYPVVQLRNIDSSQVSYFLVDPAYGWSDTTYTSVPLTTSVPLGPSLVTVFTNGIPSAAKYVLVAPKSAQALNISTRLRVQQNDNILIGGFIVTGTASKKVIVRGIGPSLNINGVPLSGRLANPFLELHDEKVGLTVETNDNWKINDQTGQSQQAAVEATTIPPADDLESAIVRTLTPGPYTAILRGANNSTGIGVVEVYDLDHAADSEMANISTRGFVETGDNVMIGGFILGNSSQGSSILVRGIGPSLAAVGISNPLANPTLELRDGNGALLGSNDNWKLNDRTQQSQESEIRATTIPPSDDLESAILTTLPPGNYTAILGGKNSGVGVALVEVYILH